MADENKTPEEEIFETYLQDANFTEEQKTAVLDALIEVGKRRNNPDYKAPEGKSVEEDVLDDYLKNNELSDEQVSTVLNAMISVEQQRLTREAAEISENLDNLSAEELESLASNWARTPGADELRAKIAARQEELRANVETNNNDVLSNITDNSNAEKGQNQEQKAESEQEQVVELKQAAENSASDNKTGTTEDEIFQEGTPVNVYNAVDVSKNLNDMLPSQLYTLRRALNARTNDETQAASAKLDDHIVTQAGKYAKDKLALTDMEEVYALNDLLTLVRDYPQSEKAQSESGKNELNAAIEKSGTEIQNFEEQYGIDKEHLQAPQVVESNIVKLDGLPQDKEIFALDVREEKMQSPTEYRDVVGILNTAQRTGNAPELSVLTGALQCNDLTEDQKKTLLELTEKRVNDTKSLSFGDFKNFEYLLTALKEAPNADKISSTLKKKEKLLSDARQAYAKSAPLKNKEFQDVYNVLSSLKVNGELKAFGREQLDQGGMDSDIALFLDQTRRETEMYLANTGKTVTPEVFSQEYAARLRNNLIEVVYADQFSKGRISEKDFGAMFDRLTAAAQSKKGININQDSFIGWQAARTNRIDTAVNKLGQKQGYENAAKSFGARVKAIDQKLTQKYGKAYSLVKGCLKSAGWGAAYSIAGAAFGPAGIAAVATASFANQAYGFIKNFKKEREAAKAKGEKPASFWQYIKKNKLRTAGLLLSGATAAIGIGGVGGNAAVQIARSAAGIGLAASGAIHQAAQAYKSTQGSKGKKTWKAIQTALFSGASFYAGMLAGREAGEIASEAFAGPTATPDVTPTLDDADTKGAPDTQVVDTPVIDVNNLTAEQQHDLQMLFSRDPAEANQILGLKGDQWMNSEQLQQAWVDGTLTPEQKAQLIDFSGQRFDNHGLFQDVEGYKPAAQMEAEAKEWTAAQNTKVEAPMQAEQNSPENPTRVNPEPLKPIMGQEELLNKVQVETMQDSRGIHIQTPEQQSDVEINKININEDKVKIVGHDDDGRFVERTSMDTLQNLPDDYDYNKIKFHDNGDISFRIDTDTGHQVNATIDQDGHYKSITSGSHVYTKEELDYVNNNLDKNPEALASNQERYAALQEMRNATEQTLSEQRNPAQEAPEKPMTDTQERSETGGMDIQTNVQVTQEGDTVHTHTDMQTTMSDNTVLSSGLTYSEVQNEAAEQLGLYQDDQTGMYTYGLGQSHDLEMARTEHDLAMKDAYVNHEVLQGLEAKGDNLTPEESALKDQCLQKQNDYAERGLIIDENGKPVFAAELLKPEVQQKLHDDYIKEMENGLDLKDVTVKNMNNGDVKIAGEIDGQQVEGRMDKNGDFKNLTINGEKVTGDELTQFNEELKYKNEALHNIVTDEAKLEAKLNETDDQRNAPLGEKVVQEQPAQETTTQGAREKPMTDTQERSETGGMDVQTSAQVTQEGDMIHTHTDTQTTMSDNTVLSSGLTYSEVQNEAAEQLGLHHDEQNGVYTYGLGQSHDIETARTEHDLAMKDAYVNHEVLQGLEAKGDNLTPEESALKDQCLQKQNDYAERGLTIDENGKPVFDDKLLSGKALEARNAERVAEAEKNLNMEDVSVQQAQGGDIKISGEINGQNIEGRLNENGEFEKLSIDGQKIKGNDLEQYNEENKINNQAIHKSAADKIAELRGLKQDSSTPAPVKGERTMINNAQLNATKGGRE